MFDVGINTGDLAVVQKNRKPISTDTVLCEIKDKYTIKRYTNVE